MMQIDKKVNTNDSFSSGERSPRAVKRYAKNISRTGFGNNTRQHLSYPKKLNTSKNGMAFKGVTKITLRKNYLNEVKNKVYVKNFDEVIGCATAAISVGGFGIGGAGLIYDSIMKRKNAKKNGSSGAVSLKRDSKPGFSSYSSYNKDVSYGVPTIMQQLTKGSNQPQSNTSALSPLLIDALNSHKRELNKPEGEAKGGSGEGYGHIVPETNFGKVGLNAGKVAMSVSGTAGFLTGVAQRVPLMAAGEVIGNLVAAPIIETPLGYGLMSIGMASLLSGRALENDPNARLNTIKLAEKKGLGKVGYIFQNMAVGIKVTSQSIGEIAKNTGRLLSFANKEKMAEGAHFFKNNFFSLKPTMLSIKQDILSNGKCVVEKGMKTNPHFLHASAAILALSGLGLAGEFALEKMGVIKKNKQDDARKACFTAAKAGQFADNIGLAKYGMERMAKGAPILGVPILASGVTALTGAPHVEKDYGKGIIWGALAFFFSMLTLERGIGAIKVFKERKALEKAFKDNGKALKEQAKSFARLFNVDISRAKGITGEDRKNILILSGAKDDAWSKIRKMSAPADISRKAEKEATDPKLKKIIRKARTIDIKAKLEERKARKALKASNDPIARQIPDFLKAVPNLKSLSGEYKVGASKKDDVKMVVDELGAMTKGDLIDLPKTALSNKSKGKLFSDDFMKFLRKDDIVTVENRIDNAKDIKDTLLALHGQNASDFGVNYTPELTKMTAGQGASKVAEEVKEAAKEAKTRFAEKLKVE